MSAAKTDSQEDSESLFFPSFIAELSSVLLLLPKLRLAESRKAHPANPRLAGHDR
jgi:hypothetical protein